MKDIIVTTPKAASELAAREAAQCLANNGGFYFRTFRVKPTELEVGSKIFYVEDGYVRGFAVVSQIVNGAMQCETSGRDWGQGWHAIMDATSWQWIKPLPMLGFQGWRYFDAPADIKIVGDWRAPKPQVKR